jgi:hypothetical protein
MAMRSTEERDRYDDVIDGAVRSMMDVDPPSGLSGRVLARLERPQTFATWFGWLAATGAVAVVLLVVFVTMMRRPDPRQSESQVVTSTPAPSRAPVGQAVPAPSRVAPVASARASTRRTVARSMGMIPGRVYAAVADQYEPTVVVAPLDPLEEIHVVPVSPAPISMTEITISSIDIQPLRVEPLSSDSSSVPR